MVKLKKLFNSLKFDIPFKICIVRIHPDIMHILFNSLLTIAWLFDTVEGLNLKQWSEFSSFNHWKYKLEQTSEAKIKMASTPISFYLFIYFCSLSLKWKQAQKTTDDYRQFRKTCCYEVAARGENNLYIFVFMCGNCSQGQFKGSLHSRPGSVQTHTHGVIPSIWGVTCLTSCLCFRPIGKWCISFPVVCLIIVL